MVIPPLRIAMVAVLVSATGLLAQKPKTVYYTWKSVQIVGGGFVDGIIFHPTAKNVRYARTDMGGAYRWDAAAQRWQPILDWVPYIDRNLMGVASIAVDPSDLNRVYLACGTYTNANTPNGAILRSTIAAARFRERMCPSNLVAMRTAAAMASGWMSIRWADVFCTSAHDMRGYGALPTEA